MCIERVSEHILQGDARREAWLCLALKLVVRRRKLACGGSDAPENINSPG
jgi:hypothetical protein